MALYIVAVTDFDPEYRDLEIQIRNVESHEEALKEFGVVGSKDEVRIILIPDELIERAATLYTNPLRAEIEDKEACILQQGERIKHLEGLIHTWVTAADVPRRKIRLLEEALLKSECRSLCQRHTCNRPGVVPAADGRTYCVDHAHVLPVD